MERRARNDLKAEPESAVVIQVASLDEARIWHNEFDVVISAGVRPNEVRWDHPAHIVRTFHDGLAGRGSATVGAIAALLAFGDGRAGSMLVHCHRGESRSTAVAIGLMVQAGATPSEAVEQLKAQHPAARGFTPNALVLSHVEAVLGLNDLVKDIARHAPTSGVLLPLATSRHW